MFQHQPTLRLSTALAIGGLVLAPIQTAFAQADVTATATATTSAGGQAGGEAGGAPAVDPPARVGRLAQLNGTVSFHAAGETQWSPATLNFPVTSGDAFWTEPQGSAVVDLGGGHFTLDQSTELDVDTLDTQIVSATEAQGDIYLEITSLAQNETYTVVTPRGSVVITQAGQYGILAGDTQSATTVTVVSGAAHVTGTALDLAVSAHQTASITGSGSAEDAFRGSVGAEADDAFLTTQLRAEQAAQQQLQRPQQQATTATATASASASVSVQRYQPPPVVQQMTGAQDLETTGSWAEAPQYGHVWYPPAEQDYVPYRNGHWAYVAPWGWTWVDQASWGFAPFHYGRWVQVQNRWGWCPVASEAEYNQPPVYAPALVSFVDPGGAALVGAAVGLAAGLAIGGAFGGGGDRGYGYGGYGYGGGGFGGGGYGGNVGWVPLGYHEPYYPPYRVSSNYVNRINSPNINRTDITRISNNYTTNNYYGAPVPAGGRPTEIQRTPPRFANAAAATAVPAAAMAQSRLVAPLARPLTPQQVEQARPVGGVPVRPLANTAGITPAAARQFGIPPTQLAQRAANPGPAVVPRNEVPVRPGVGGTPVAAAARIARPPLAPVGGLKVQPGHPAAAALIPPGEARPNGEPARPGVGQPGVGQPGLGQPVPGQAGQPGQPGVPRAGEAGRPAVPGQLPGQLPGQTPGQPRVPGVNDTARPGVPNAGQPRIPGAATQNPALQNGEQPRVPATGGAARPGLPAIPGAAGANAGRPGVPPGVPQNGAPGPAIVPRAVVPGAANGPGAPNGARPGLPQPGAPQPGAPQLGAPQPGARQNGAPGPAIAPRPNVPGATAVPGAPGARCSRCARRRGSAGSAAACREPSRCPGDRAERTAAGRSGAGSGAGSSRCSRDPERPSGGARDPERPSGRAAGPERPPERAERSGRPARAAGDHPAARGPAGAACRGRAERQPCAGDSGQGDSGPGATAGSAPGGPSGPGADRASGAPAGTPPAAAAAPGRSRNNSSRVRNRNRSPVRSRSRNRNPGRSRSRNASHRRRHPGPRRRRRRVRPLRRHGRFAPAAVRTASRSIKGDR